MALALARVKIRNAAALSGTVLGAPRPATAQGGNSGRADVPLVPPGYRPRTSKRGALGIFGGGDMHGAS